MAMFDKFKEYSVAEFFKKNRQMLGFSGKIRSLTTIVHEYVTNSLDACEEANILPEIEIHLENGPKSSYILSVQDNGPGIPEKIVGRALGMMLAGTKFNRYMQQRGQQGIGAAGCTMFSLLTTGKPIEFVSKHKGKVFKGKLSIDFKKNKPILTETQRGVCDASEHGIFVRAHFSGIKYDKSAFSVLEYLRRTAIANPHASITFYDPNGDKISFPRSIEQVPKRPKEVKPHPLGLETSDILDFAKLSKEQSISQFLRNDLTRVSVAKLNEIKDLCPDIDFRKNPKKLTWQEAERLKDAFKQIKWISPSTDSIIPIGKKQIEISLTNILNPSFLYVSERRPRVYRGGVPFLVEIGLTYGGSSGKTLTNGQKDIDILRFANRAPLLFDAGSCAISEAVKSIDWRQYGLRSKDEVPLTVFINFVSVHVPYTGAGKQAISHEQEIMDEIKLAIQEGARVLKKYIHSIVREKERKAKKKAVLKYAEQLIKDMCELSDVKDKKEIEFLKQQLIYLVNGKYLLNGGQDNES